MTTKIENLQKQIDIEELTDAELSRVCGGVNVAGVTVAARAALFINPIGNKVTVRELKVEDLISESESTSLSGDLLFN